eukprot:4227045-Amphidinium_carterae.1
MRGARMQGNCCCSVRKKSSCSSSRHCTDAFSKRKNHLVLKEFAWELYVERSVWVELNSAGNLRRAVGI